MKNRHNGNGAGDTMARALGWFSIGLGAAELFAPRPLAKMIGIKPNNNLLRMLGLREIVSGVGILAKPQAAGWVWSRVAGDVVDLTLLGLAVADNRHTRGRLLAVTAAAGAVTALDIACSRQLSLSPEQRKIQVRKSITVNRSPQELYAFWRNFENLPRFMYHLESVTNTDNGRSHWIAKGPVGTHIEWEAEITADQPNELIAWRSLPESDIQHQGEVRFQPALGGRGTVVRVELQYEPPAGKLGAAVAKLFGEEPEVQLRDDLDLFKQFMETGQILTTEGQPSGRGQSESKYDRVTTLTEAGTK